MDRAAYVAMTGAKQILVAQGLSGHNIANTITGNASNASAKIDRFLEAWRKLAQSLTVRRNIAA